LTLDQRSLHAPLDSQTKDTVMRFVKPDCEQMGLGR
jgi:hypothetical protein